MTERVWGRFRRLPRWAQVVAWMLLAPFLAALWLWRVPRARIPARVLSVFLALFGAAYVGAFAADEGRSSNTAGQHEARRGGRVDEAPKPEPSPEKPSSTALPAASSTAGTPPDGSSKSPIALPSGVPAGAHRAIATPSVRLSSPAPSAPAPSWQPQAELPPATWGNCHPSYPDVCIPPDPPDLDCGEIAYKQFQVRHDVADPDPHGFDGDKDGVGCER